jgi:hypothetical protein
MYGKNGALAIIQLPIIPAEIERPETRPSISPKKKEERLVLLRR